MELIAGRQNMREGDKIDRLLSLYVTHDINRLRQVRPIFPASLS